MPVTLEKFVDSLSITGLLAPDEMQAIRAGVSERNPPPDVETLARELVRAGKLTAFQATAIYHGKAKGLVCGEYVLLEKIGAGGMGQVFRGRHKRMNRIVAVKLLAPHVKAANKERAIKRFYQEVELAARLVHPNIVTAYDAGESQGLHYMVMEYVEGQDVSSCLKPDKKLPLDQGLNIVLQAARGLQYAHSQGIIHRDIKPSNLLMDHQGNVKILDMGLARVEAELSGAGAQAPAAAGLTHSGEVMGTLDYMAPEQARNTRDADARSDIYSLGCTLYRLVTGRVPYDGESTVEKILAHYERPIPELAERCDGISRKLEQAYQRMLAKQPADRFQTMSEVITTLEACRAAVPESDYEVLVTDEPPPKDALGSSFLSKAGVSALGLGPSGMTPIPLPPLGGSDPQVRLAPSAPPAPAQAPAAWKSPQFFVLGSLSVIVLALIFAIVFVLTQSDPKRDGAKHNLANASDSAASSPSVEPGDGASDDPSAKSSNTGTKEPKPGTAENSTTASTNSPAPPDVSFPGIPLPGSEPKEPEKPVVVVSPVNITSPAPTPTQTTSPELPAVAAPTSAPTRPGVRVDLLRALDLKRDIVSGVWTLDGHELVAPSTNDASRLQLPYAPPPSYELSMVIQPLTFGGWSSLGLIVGSSRVCFMLDESNRTSGLDSVGRNGFSRNETTMQGLPRIGQGDPAVILCRIKPDSVFVMLNGRTVVDWQGDANQLSVSTTYACADKSKLSLVTNGSGYRITKLEVVPLGGQPASVPSPSVVAQAATKIADLVGPALPANADDRRQSQRAASLHYQASLVGDDNALCYALLTEAIKTATAAEDVFLLNYLSDDLARCFQGNRTAQMNAALEQITALNRSPANRRELAIRLLELASETCLAEQYENAAVLAAATQTLLAKTKEADLLKEAQACELETREFQKLSVAATAAGEQLETDADSATANLIVGQYLSIARGDWSAALTRLAKGDEPDAAAAARLELQAAKDPSRSAEIGTAWLTAAEKASGAPKAVYGEHARMWLSRGSTNLSGQAMTKLFNRFKKVDSDTRRQSGTAFVKRHPVRSVAFGGHWYQYLPQKLSWHEARQHCQDLGGDLICLESPAECQWAYSFATAQFGTPEVFDFWIGATDQGHENFFAWVNGSPFQFTNWDAGEPDNDAAQDVVVAGRKAIGSPDFRWMDAGSSARKVFICEWDR